MQSNDALPAANREGHFVGVEAEELQEGQKFGDGTSSIMSFKDVGLYIGELDFQARLSTILNVKATKLALYSIFLAAVDEGLIRQCA